MSDSTRSTTNCASGILVHEPDDVGEQSRRVVARRAARDHDVAAEAPAGRVGDEAVGGAQQRALARARRADHEQHVAGRDAEVDAVERVRAVRVPERHAAVLERPAHAPIPEVGADSAARRRRRCGDRRPRRVGAPAARGAGRSAIATTGSKRGQRNGLAYQASVSLPTRRHDRRARPVRARPRRRATSRRGASAGVGSAGAGAPREPRHTPRPSATIPTTTAMVAAVVARPIAARNAAASASSASERTPARLGLGPGRPADAEPACVHRLRERDRPFQAAFEHRDDRTQQAAAAHRMPTGAGEVGIAHRAHRLDRRRHERERHRDHDAELVERARRRLHQLVVRPRARWRRRTPPSSRRR